MENEKRKKNKPPPAKAETCCEVMSVYEIIESGWRKS